jgi:hypothetical protein
LKNDTECLRKGWGYWNEMLGVIKKTVVQMGVGSGGWGWYCKMTQNVTEKGGGIGMQWLGVIQKILVQMMRGGGGVLQNDTVFHRKGRGVLE